MNNDFIDVLAAVYTDCTKQGSDQMEGTVRHRGPRGFGCDNKVLTALFLMQQNLNRTCKQKFIS